MDAGIPVELLAETPIFAGLGRKDLEALASRCGERTYRRDETVFRQGDPGDALFVVAEGRFKVYVTAPSGDVMVLATVGRGEVFGELAVVDGGPRSATVEATEPARLLTLARPAVLDTISRHPAVNEVLLRALGSLVRRANEQAADLVFLDLHGRVAKLLVGLAERTGEKVLDLGVTQRDLASMVGGSRQSVNLILHEFERRGFVALEQRKVVVLDLAALERRAGLAG